MSSTLENIVIGGGMIGLSIAYELAKRGRSVAVLEQDQFGRKASWAGAGILVPANAATAIHPQEQLEALSHKLHEQWATELLQLTGIDNGFRKCGGLYIARTSGEVATLSGMAFEWKAREIECEAIDGSELLQRFPAFVSSQRSGSKPQSEIQRAIWVAGEAQIANPLHLSALVAACQKLGVVMEQEVGATRVIQTGGTLGGVTASGKTYVARNYFFAAGAWTEQLVEPIGVRLPMQPVRGQIALYRIPPEFQSTADWPIVNEGSRYLVPRRDGHVLAGATIEEVGFDCQTTSPEIDDLRSWAEGLHGDLNETTFVKSWAGLRPGTYDGFAYLGRLGTFGNAFVATGHFKSGLHLSSGTAVVMADLAEGKIVPVDLRPFSPARVADHHSIDSA